MLSLANKGKDASRRLSSADHSVLRKTGLDIFDDIPWGTHISLFYKTRQDLLEILIPYIQSGLENNEYCIWITSEALSSNKAQSALRKTLPDFDTYHKNGQIVFINYKKWYKRDGNLRLDDVYHEWLKRLDQALAKGYEGIRITGNTGWLENENWEKFQDYERSINQIIRDYRIIAMCSYALDKCEASQIIDVVYNHQSALIRCSGEWKLIGNYEDEESIQTLAAGSQTLQKSRQTLEALVEERNKNLHILNEILKAEIRRHTRTEQALHISDQKYRSLFNSIDEGFSLYEISSTENKKKIYYQCLDVNPAFENLIGIKAEELIGRKLSDIIPAIPAAMISAINKAAATKDPVYIEEYIDYLDKIIAFRIFYLKTRQIAILSTDITDRKRAEESLRLSEQKFSKAFHSSPSIMTINTLDDWNYIDVNEMFCRLTGYSREEIIGRSTRDTRIWCEPEDIRNITNMIIDGEPVQNFEIPYYTKSGDKRIGLMSSEVIIIDGQPCLLNSITDISQRIQIQEEIARLDRLNLIGQMAASISHETRNPMTTVRGFLQMLRSRKEYQNDVEYFDIMIDELDRADSIITEFLSLAPNIKLQLEKGNLNTIINNLNILIQADALANDIHIQLELEEIPNQLLDPKEIRQLLLNLIRNAMEAMGPGKTITIRTYSADDDIVLEVKDEGPGIPAEILNKIGTPFLTTKDEGTGLGLSVCYSIADRHHAVIDVDTSDSGTVFFIRFKQ